MGYEIGQASLREDINRTVEERKVEERVHW